MSQTKLYKFFKNWNGETVGLLKDSPDDNYVISVPMNDDNIDYQEYKIWVAEGNTAEAAD